MTSFWLRQRKKTEKLKVEWYIALRYLFAKKRHNTINLITWISMAGVAVGTMALICVLSVLNGFERVVESSFSNFDPDLKVVASSGTRMDESAEELIAARKALKGRAIWCEVVEQDGLVSTEDLQVPVKVKGVGAMYGTVTNFDQIIWAGRADFTSVPYEGSVGVMGVGLAQKLGLSVEFMNRATLYVPKNRKVNLSRPDANFTKLDFKCGGIFYSEQTEYDDQYIVLPVDIVRDAYRFDDDYVNAYEIKAEGDAEKLEKELQEMLGADYQVLNRHEQKADFYKISKIEKWTTFMILSFIMLIATFNIIGSLSMIIIEKRQDIELFRNLGATERSVKKIFRAEGFLISAFGAVAGMVTGIIIVLVQQKFGLLKLGAGFITNAYPVELQIVDILLVMIVVLGMGALASLVAQVGRGVKNN